MEKNKWYIITIHDKIFENIHDSCTYKFYDRRVFRKQCILFESSNVIEIFNNTLIVNAFLFIIRISLHRRTRFISFHLVPARGNILIFKNIARHMRTLWGSKL